MPQHKTVVALLALAILALALVPMSRAYGLDNNFHTDDKNFSTIDVMSVNYDSGSSSTAISSAFRGRLYCQDGCTTDDKFSIITGVTTHTLNFEIQSVEITFFDEKTGEVLILLNQQRFLQFQLTANRFDDKTIPWLKPIPAGTTVGFKGSFNYNWIKKDIPNTIDSGMMIYTPANQYVYPQNIVFDQKFSAQGAEFAFVDGFWSSKDQKEGKLMAIIDNIKVDVAAIQIKLIGVKWLSDMTRGCVINGDDAYSVVMNSEFNTMTFVTQKPIPARSDIIIQCHEPIISIKDVAPVDFGQKETYAEIRFAQQNWHANLPYFFYPFTLPRPLFNVIDSAVPDFTPRAIVYGDNLMCSFKYTLFDQAGRLVPLKPEGEFFSFALNGIDSGNPGSAIVHVTSDKVDNPMVLQRVNKLTQNKNVYNRSPLTLTIPKDHLHATDSVLEQVYINVLIPLDGVTIGSNGLSCRMNLVRPNPTGELVYSATSTASVYDRAFESISLPRWSKPLNGTSTAFELNLKGAKSKFTFLTVTTSTFDFLWSGDSTTCGVTEFSNDQSKPKKTYQAEVKPVVKEQDLVEFAERSDDGANRAPFFRVAAFGLTLNDTIAVNTSVRIVCPDLVYAALPSAEHDNDIIRSPNTILIHALDSTQDFTAPLHSNFQSNGNEDKNAPKLYGSAMVTNAFPIKKKGFNPFLLILGLIILTFLGLGFGFFCFRRFQASKRKDQEQFEILLNEERTTLVIQ